MDDKKNIYSKKEYTQHNEMSVMWKHKHSRGGLDGKYVKCTQIRLSLIIHHNVCCVKALSCVRTNFLPLDFPQ